MSGSNALKTTIPQSPAINLLTGYFNPEWLFFIVTLYQNSGANPNPPPIVIDPILTAFAEGDIGQEGTPSGQELLPFLFGDDSPPPPIQLSMFEVWGDLPSPVLPELSLVPMVMTVEA